MGNGIEYVNVTVRHGNNKKPFVISKGTGVGTRDKKDIPTGDLIQRSGNKLVIDAKTKEQYSAICIFLEKADADKNKKIDINDMRTLEKNGGTKDLYIDGMGDIIGIDRKGNHFSIDFGASYY